MTSTVLDVMVGLLTFTLTVTLLVPRLRDWVNVTNGTTTSCRLAPPCTYW
ncbi:hypothetical protein [Rhodococcus sp. NPDC058521]